MPCRDFCGAATSTSTSLLRWTITNKACAGKSREDTLIVDGKSSRFVSSSRSNRGRFSESSYPERATVRRRNYICGRNGAISGIALRCVASHCSAACMRRAERLDFPASSFQECTLQFSFRCPMTLSYGGELDRSCGDDDTNTSQSHMCLYASLCRATSCSIVSHAHFASASQPACQPACHSKRAS